MWAQYLARAIGDAFGRGARVKLAAELSRPNTGHGLLLDEPTTGLHFDDVKLLEVLNRLVDLGNTVIVVEHN